MIELLKDVWVNQKCVSAFWVSDITEEGKSFFLRRKKEKVVGFTFTVIFASSSVPLEYVVETKKERDAMITKLKGCLNG